MSAAGCGVDATRWDEGARTPTDPAAFWVLLAHELRTPLGVIRGACELALDGSVGSASEGVGVALRDIARAARQLEDGIAAVDGWQLSAGCSDTAVELLELAPFCEASGLPTTTAAAGLVCVRGRRQELHALLRHARRWLTRADGGEVRALVEVQHGLPDATEVVVRLEGPSPVDELDDLGRLNLTLCRMLIERQGGRMSVGVSTLLLVWPQP